MKNKQPIIVDLYRGPAVESYHQVILSVVDYRGYQIGYAGNFDFPTFPRSSIKMLQALPFFESGAFDAFGLEHRHLAMACASHESEEFHVKFLDTWLKKLNLPMDALACGPHRPYNKTYSDKITKESKPLNRIMNNCSGKHLGMLTTALHKKEKTEGYHQWDHPVQQRILQTLDILCQHPISKSPSAIDGCGIPTICAPIKNWAMGMAALLSPQLPPERQRAVRAILEAVTKYPEYMSGSQNFCAQVIRGSESQVIVKSGAEGFYCGLILAKGIGFAVKAIDGHSRAAQAGVGVVLDHFAQLTDKTRSVLKPLFESPTINTRNEVVGKICLRKFEK